MDMNFALNVDKPFPNTKHIRNFAILFVAEGIEIKNINAKKKHGSVDVS